MKFQVIASGSSGNCTYIESKEKKILLDAGISIREIENRCNVDLDKIDAILITHAHIDHVGSLMQLIKRTNAVLYIHKDTLEECIKKFKYDFNSCKIQFIENNKKYLIGDIGIFTMQLSHDCANCNGFIFVVKGDSSLGYITDTGLVPLTYIPLLQKLDMLILESNHDITMLNESKRPWFLKQRILSIKGHLSNITCGEILNKIIETGKLKLVVLAHLSKDCNDEKLAVDTVLSELTNESIPDILVAHRDYALDMIDTSGDKNEN